MKHTFRRHTFDLRGIAAALLLVLGMGLAAELHAQSAQLSLADLLIGLRSQKVSIEERNRILAEAVRERGITFQYTPEIARELAATGAGTELLTAVLEKGTPPAPKPTPTPTPEPRDHSFFRKRADDHAKKGEFQLAVADYDKAEEMRADDPAIFLNRAKAHFGLESFARSVADFSKALELQPRSAEIYINRGVSFEKLGESEKAIADYRQALEIDPRNAVAAGSLKRLEDEKAAAAAEAAAKAKPPRPVILEVGTVGAQQAEKLVMPSYPTFAQRMNLEGRVTVAIEVDESGKVVSAKAIDGPNMLRDAAENAARRSSFKPFLFDGTPIRAKGSIVYSFTKNAGE
ncbi:MAG TPA: TonB family protein [Pyrinomonadaceae bacterium]|nr:TonB family protein [Pyrinomonadaceae bacterium]